MTISSDVTSSVQPFASCPYRALRIWPAAILVLLMIVARFVPAVVENGPAMIWVVPAFVPLLCGVLLVVWWLAASRARWFERLIGLAGIIVAVVGTMMLLDPSMRGPGFTVVTVPMGLAAFSIGAMACSRMLNVRRTFIAVLMACCGCGFSLALRADGLWGNYSVGLHWRWQPSAEQRLLASADRGKSIVVDDAGRDALAQSLSDPEWPAFRGADRRGRQSGTRLSTDWSTLAPQQIWTITVGPAWSSFVVAGQLLFTQEQRGPHESIVAYDASSGREVWVQHVESRFDDPLGGPGPRATPTLAMGKLYVMGAQGHLLRLDSTTGAIEWKQDLREIARPTPPTWGFSSSPLVEQGLVIVHAGGADDKGVLAFDAEDGHLRWSAAAGDHTYSSPQICEIAGERLIAMVTNKGMNLLDTATGAERLRYDWATEGYRVLQPQMIGDDSMLIATGMGTGTRLVKFTLNDESLVASEVWTSKQLKPDFNDLVVYQGHAYGFDGAFFTCINLQDGQRCWKGGRYGKGQVLLIEDSGILLVASEHGDVVLVKADPARHIELARFKALEGKTWNHPVVVGDRLYIRNAEQAACWQLPIAGDNQRLSKIGM